MKAVAFLVLSALPTLLWAEGSKLRVTRDIPYAEPAHERGPQRTDPADHGEERGHAVTGGRRANGS